MMKLIKGRKYNTDTAKLIGVVGEQQKLYSKRTGEFFLYFVDKKIVPLSFDKAKKIVKEKLDQDIYNQLFERKTKYFSRRSDLWISKYKKIIGNKKQTPLRNVEFIN